MIPQIIAHRGASYLAPENTLAAFRKAMDAKEKAEAEKEKGDEDAEAEDKERASDSAESSHLKADSPAKEAGLGDLEKPKE